MNTPHFFTSDTFMLIFVLVIIALAVSGVGSRESRNPHNFRRYDRTPGTPQQNPSRQFNISLNVNYSSSNSSHPTSSIYQEQTAPVIPEHGYPSKDVSQTPPTFDNPRVRHRPVEREISVTNQQLTQLNSRR